MFGHGDVTAFGVRYQTGGTADLASAGISTRFPLGEAWRLGPRVRVDQRRFAADDSRELLYVPTLRVEYLRRKLMVEAEAGAEFGARDNGSSTQQTNRTYFSLGYRYTF